VHNNALARHSATPHCWSGAPCSAGRVPARPVCSNETRIIRVPSSTRRWLIVASSERAAGCAVCVALTKTRTLRHVHTLKARQTKACTFRPVTTATDLMLSGSGRSHRPMAPGLRVWTSRSPLSNLLACSGERAEAVAEKNTGSRWCDGIEMGGAEKDS
jgi:hypothetical protein